VGHEGEEDEILSFLRKKRMDGNIKKMIICDIYPSIHPSRWMTQIFAIAIVKKGIHGEEISCWQHIHNLWIGNCDFFPCARKEIQHIHKERNLLLLTKKYVYLTV